LPISHVMFKVGVTYGQARTYLLELESLGFIDRGIAGNFYHTTPNGMEYLAAINQITDMLEKAVG